jgi:uncharacterized zinc-type alcohol dehydrogenase-like protein
LDCRGRVVFDLILTTANVKTGLGNAYIATFAPPKGRFAFFWVYRFEPLDINVFFPLIANQCAVSGSPVGSPAGIAHHAEFLRSKHKNRAGG